MSGFRMPNFEGGFTFTLSPEGAEAIKAAIADAPIDPSVDERWDAWRCPGCGKSHDEVGPGHAWHVDHNTGNATCNAEPPRYPDSGGKC